MQGFLLGFLNGCADEFAFGGIGCVVNDLAGVVIHLQKGARSVAVDDRLHPGGFSQVLTQFTLEILQTAAGSEHRSKVTACGSSPDRNLFGVDPEFLGPSPQPADRRFAIMNLSGPLSLFAQPVTNGGSDVAPSGNEGWNSVGAVAAFLVATTPSTPMDPNDERERFVFFTVVRDEQIEGLTGVFPTRVIEISFDRVGLLPNSGLSLGEA